MTKFVIIQTDNPYKYKKRIIKLWNEYLKDTPNERFEWLKSGNPAGPAIWFLALSKDTNELIGTVSLMPRYLMQNGRMLLTAVMGDLMVDKNHRVYGPAIKLLKAAIRGGIEHDFDFIYTLPNPDSIKITQRLGFKQLIYMNTYVKPIDISFYIEKYLPRIISKIMAVPIAICQRVFSKEIYLMPRGYFDVMTDVDSSFDKFWNQIRSSSRRIVGDHSSVFIKWRYMCCPLNKFRILTYQENKEGGIVGYICFTTDNRRMHVYDIISIKDKFTDMLLKGIIGIARREGCKAIDFTVPVKSIWPNQLKLYGFLNSKTYWWVYFFPNKEISLGNWAFFPGDRNI